MSSFKSVVLSLEQLNERVVPTLFALESPSGMFSISPSTPPEVGAEYNPYFTHIESDGDDVWFERVSLVSGPETAFARLKPGNDRAFQVGSSEAGLLVLRVTAQDTDGELVDNYVEITALPLSGIGQPQQSPANGPPTSPPYSPPSPTPDPDELSRGPIVGQYDHGLSAISAVEVGILDAHGATVDWFNPGGTSNRAALADVTGDGTPDLIIVGGPGNAPGMWIYDRATGEKIFDALVFEESFRGGLLVSAGDIDGDGAAEIVVTPDEGGGPRARVYHGRDFKVIHDFFVIEDSNFRGGARTAVGDLNGDGYGDILAAAGFGGGPRVAGFDGAWLQERRKLFHDFFVFEETLRNGVYVGAGDLNGDGCADAIFGAGPGGGPRVRVLDAVGLLNNREQELANFFAGDPNDRNGVRVDGADLDQDPYDDIVTSSGSKVTAYRGSNLELKWQREPFGPLPVDLPIYVG